MRYCKSCKLNVTGSNQICPLCKNELEKGNDSTNVFPVIPSIYEELHIVFKVLIFLSILCTTSSLLLDYIISNNIDWSIFIVVGVIFFWFNLISSIYKRNNPNSIIFNQVLLFSFCSIIYDYLTGWHLWSITYAIPFICIAAMTEMFIASLILRYRMHNYVVYLLGTAIIGIVQIVFTLFNIITVTWPSVVCFILSIMTISTIMIFANKKSKKELKRKFHI